MEIEAGGLTGQVDTDARYCIFMTDEVIEQFRKFTTGLLV